MNIWIVGATQGGPEQRHFLADWFVEHLEAHPAHTLFASSWHVGDRERGEWVEVLRSSDADVLVNFAQLGGGYRCQRLPLTAAELNVGGAALLAQAAAEAGVPFVQVSSSEATVGDSLYGITKLAGEQAARLHAPACQVVRLYGVYGPGGGGDLDGPLPNLLLVAQLTDGPRERLHEQVRRGWCYAADAARALRLIVEDGRPGLWNVGRFDNELSMLELGRLAATAAGADPALLTPAPWPPNAPVTKSPDVSALLALGWQPEVELPEGLAKTAEWLRAG